MDQKPLKSTQGTLKPLSRLHELLSTPKPRTRNESEEPEDIEDSLSSESISHNWQRDIYNDGFSNDIFDDQSDNICDAQHDDIYDDGYENTYDDPHHKIQDDFIEGQIDDVYSPEGSSQEPSTCRANLFSPRTTKDPPSSSLCSVIQHSSLFVTPSKRKISNPSQQQTIQGPVKTPSQWAKAIKIPKTLTPEMPSMPSFSPRTKHRDGGKYQRDSLVGKFKQYILNQKSDHTLWMHEETNINAKTNRMSQEQSQITQRYAIRVQIVQKLEQHIFHQLLLFKCKVIQALLIDGDHLCGSDDRITLSFGDMIKVLFCASVTRATGYQTGQFVDIFRPFTSLYIGSDDQYCIIAGRARPVDSMNG